MKPQGASAPRRQRPLPFPSLAVHRGAAPAKGELAGARVAPLSLRLAGAALRRGRGAAACRAGEAIPGSSAPGHAAPRAGTDLCSRTLCTESRSSRFLVTGRGMLYLPAPNIGTAGGRGQVERALKPRSPAARPPVRPSVRPSVRARGPAAPRRGARGKRGRESAPAPLRWDTACVVCVRSSPSVKSRPSDE